MTSADAFDDDMPGEEIAPILMSGSGKALAQTLVGLRFYVEDPNVSAEIVDCDPNTAMLSLATTNGRKRVRLATGYVLVDERFRAHFDAVLSPAMRAERSQRRLIAAFGFSPRIEQQDLAVLADAISKSHALEVPPSQERAGIFALAGKYGGDRQIEKFCKLWLNSSSWPPPADILIALVAALRHTSRTVEALGHTDILLDGGPHFAPSATRVLLTQRAALWLDRFEQTGDRKMLERARRSAGMSWAIAHSDECNLVYKRLKWLEGTENEG